MDGNPHFPDIGVRRADGGFFGHSGLNGCFDQRVEVNAGVLPRGIGTE